VELRLAAGSRFAETRRKRPRSHAVPAVISRGHADAVLAETKLTLVSLSARLSTSQHRSGTPDTTLSRLPFCFGKHGLRFATLHAGLARRILRGALRLEIRNLPTTSSCSLNCDRSARCWRSACRLSSHQVEFLCLTIATPAPNFTNHWALDAERCWMPHPQSGRSIDRLSYMARRFSRPGSRVVLATRMLPHPAAAVRRRSPSPASCVTEN
jgi:hypothetical protein